MNLEQIDTNTTAGKAEVMRLAAEGRKVAGKSRTNGDDWHPLVVPAWNWVDADFDIIAEPVGPEELWAVVFSTHTINFDSRKDSEEAARRNGATVVRYIRADLAGEKG